MPNFDIFHNRTVCHRHTGTFQKYFPKVYEAPSSYIPGKSTKSCYERSFDDLIIDFLRGQINKEAFAVNFKLLVNHFAENAQAQKLKYMLSNPFRNVKKVCFTVEKKEGNINARITDLVIKGSSSKISELREIIQV